MNAITLNPGPKIHWPEWAQRAWEAPSDAKKSITPFWSDGVLKYLIRTAVGRELILPAGRELHITKFMEV